MRLRLFLQPLHLITYVTAHSPTLPPLYIRHISFYSHSVASRTSQLHLQPFRRFTFIRAHCTTLPFLHLRHRHFTHVKANSATLPPLHLRHSSFYNPSADSPTSQVILQPFRFFTYVTGTSRTPMHRGMKKQCGGLACYSKLLSLEVATVMDSC